MSNYGYVTDHEAKVRPMNEELFRKEVDNVKSIMNEIAGIKEEPKPNTAQETTQEEPKKEEPETETPKQEELVKQPENTVTGEVKTPDNNNADTTKEFPSSIVVDGVTYTRSTSESTTQE